LPAGGALVSTSILVVLATLYVVNGVLFGIFLNMAATDGAWWTVVALAAATYILLTAGILFGPFGLLLAFIALAALGLRYGQTHLIRVPQGKAVLTSFLGVSARTLLPGRALRMPYEEVTHRIDASEQMLAAGPRGVDLRGPSGIMYRARASVTAACAVIPSAARTVAELDAPWPEIALEQIDNALTDILDDWGTRILAGTDRQPAQLLSQLTLAELQFRLRLSGITVRWVKMHDVWFDIRDRVPDVESDAPPDLVPEELLWADVPPPAGARTAPPPAWDSPPGTSETPEDTTPQPLLDNEVLAPDVLAAAYDMVRTGQVKDPLIIRDIAAAFLRVAQDAERSATCPFDAASAAEILLERAMAIELGDVSVQAGSRSDLHVQ
jgi:hypothetical protein